MTDPFTLVIAKGAKFCDRENEQAELLDHIKNHHNVVVSAKRRMGKSSLVEQVLPGLSDDGILTVTADCMSISGEQDFMSLFAAAIVRGVGREAADPRSMIEKAKGLFSKLVPVAEVKPDGFSIGIRFDRNAGLDILLGDVLGGLYGFAKKKKQRIVVCLDEFQEITRLKESNKIEGTLRSWIQSDDKYVSFLFVGSRRRILLDMFSEKSRPFYKIAYIMPIGEIPAAEFTAYIEERFKSTKKKCDRDTARLIYDMVRGHTYYVQKLASLSWSSTPTICTPGIVQGAYQRLLKIEVATELEGIWRGLPMGQRRLMKALAKEPTKSPYSSEFLTYYGAAAGSMRRALEGLLQEDLVELGADGVYALTNPLFAAWLCQMDSLL